MRLWRVLFWVIAALMTVDQVQAQPVVPNSWTVIQRRGVVVHPPSGSGRPPSGATPSNTAPPAQPAQSTTTPFTLTGQTICSRGTVEERPVEQRRYWFDGASVRMPGFRCITLP